VFRVLIDAFVHRYMDPALRPDVVAGLDARGFIIGAWWPTSWAWASCRSARRASCPSPP
jgi:hypothetical protein